MNPSNYLWLTAGIAGITAAWSQVRSVFSRLLAFFFVTVTLDQDATLILTAWLWENAQLSPFGNSLYTGQLSFIRPKDRYGIVAYRTIGQRMTFLFGVRPLFLTMVAEIIRSPII